MALLLVLTAFTWIGNPAQPELATGRPGGLSAGAPDSSSASTTTAAPAANDTTKDTRASGDGPRNLLPNASFENGPEGWRPIGETRLTRSTEARDGGWSLRIQADPAAEGPVGITVPNVTLTKVQGRYHTNAWVRPSSPNTTVTIGLREYKGGQPVPGSNTLGWTVERTGWRQFGAIHVASQSGSRLALEIMARDLPPGGYLDIDEVVLHLLGNR